jgi:hypothetical protein
MKFSPKNIIAATTESDRIGYLFQGRFKAFVVDKDAYIFELSRYIVLNPVRTGMVLSADGWPWSSYRAMAGLVSIVASGWANISK